MNEASLDVSEGREELRVLQVHHFRYPVVVGGVDRVVGDIVESGGRESCVLFEVGDWNDRSLSSRIEGEVTVYRRRIPRSIRGNGFLRAMLVSAEMMWVTVLLLWIMRRERISIVHLHTLQDYHRHFVFLARLRLCRYAVTLHRAETLEFNNVNPGRRRRWTRILRHAAGITAVSSTLASIALENLPIRRAPTVVYNGIEDPLDQLRPESAAADPGSAYAISVGTLLPYKGHDVAIQAWAELKGRGVNLKLHIAGEGEWRPHLEALIRACDCRDSVALLGAVDHNHVLQLVRGALVYLMPSRNEGLGVALIEAAALEKPIIASDISVFREIVEDGVSARLFPVGDAQALATAVEATLADTDAAAAMAREARRRFLSAFTRERMSAGYMDLYRKLIH